MKLDFYPTNEQSFSLSDAARAEHFTFTFVRHPFSRLVSGYTNKFDKDWRRLPKSMEFRDVKDSIALKSGLHRNT